MKRQAWEFQAALFVASMAQTMGAYGLAVVVVD
jgi:hypothetical protein